MEAGDLSDGDAKFLIKNFSNFEKLTVLDLNLNRMSTSVTESIKAVLPHAHVAKQLEEDEPIYVNKIYQEAYRLKD